MELARIWIVTLRHVNCLHHLGNGISSLTRSVKDRTAPSRNGCVNQGAELRDLTRVLTTFDRMVNAVAEGDTYAYVLSPSRLGQDVNLKRRILGSLSKAPVLSSSDIAHVLLPDQMNVPRLKKSHAQRNEGREASLTARYDGSARMQSWYSLRHGA